MDFGRKELLKSLVKRINHQFDAMEKDPVEKSLVIGVFGEWGSGKSYLLDAIGKAVNEPRKDLAKERAITLPVSFNPWRFEAEEHLIIPLLLTAQSALLAKAKEDKTAGSKTADFLKQTAGRLALISVAFASAFKGKMGIPGIGDATFDMNNLRKAYNEEFALKKEANDNHDPLYFPQELTSIYYNFHDYLKQVTGRDNKESTRLNLLFLIDDIDRCLPERAVNMMEAIKLFLEVEGCAFVLALDDEVVERGILHRYKDYLFQQQDSKNDTFHRPPITGVEYLEKMIHLPVRLPLPTKHQTAAFLVNRFPELFSVNEREPMEIQSIAKGRQRTQGQSELLDLFLEAVPRIPRKLVRAAELLKLMIDVAEGRGVNSLDAVMLARLVILQLFSPEVYRLARRYPELMLTMAKWAKKKGDHWRKGQFLEARLTEVKEEIENDGKDAGAIRYLENVEKPLLWLIQKACQTRSGFDPRVIMFRLEAESLSEELLHRYFNLAEEMPAEPVEDHSDERKTAVIDNIAEFLENLFSSRDEVWRAALGQKVLQRRVLNEVAFEALLARFNEIGEERAEQFLNNPAWLLRLVRHLNDSQLKLLDEKTHFVAKLKKLLTAAAIDLADDETVKGKFAILNDYAAVHWGVELSQRLRGSEQTVIEHLLQIVEKGGLKPKLRAEAGDALAQLGDPRFDPDQFYLPIRYQGQPEPNLGFIKIDGGSFMMGSNKDDPGEPYDDEMVNGKAHQVNYVKYDYWMARYPVTVAQYGAFLTAGGYDAIEDYWGDGGQAWLSGEWDSQLTVDDFNGDEKRFENVKKWLEQRSPELRQQPMEWSKQLHFSNRPVHGVSWFEARAYCRWLTHKLSRLTNDFPSNYVARLPTEAEWEKAARADDHRIYPWGDEWDENRLNANQKIGRVSTVGMYPGGVNPKGLHDLSGNVWEWTHSLLRDYPCRPNKADWQTRQGGDRLVLRGGSWFDNHRLTRCAVRINFNPDNCNSIVGFRVVISLASDD